MNQKIKELWIAALRSGEYKQSQHALRTVSGYCCLGVLCDVGSKIGLGNWRQGVEGQWVFEPLSGNARRENLPAEIVTWAGLRDANPDTANGSLASMNDHGKTFGEIADIIERDL